MNKDIIWLTFFITSDFINRIAHGMFGTLIGPSQPYLAKHTNVNIDTVTLLWTFGSLSGMISSFFTARIFKAYIKTTLLKMTWIAFWTAIMALSTIVFPMVNSFPLLVFMFSLRFFAALAWETAGSTLYVYTLGPIKSRPFIMAYHFLVGVGFVLGPSVIKYYFPPDDDEANDSVCNSETKEDLNQLDKSKDELDINVIMSHIQWPYIYVALVQLLCGVGYIVTGCLSIPMPSYRDDKISASEEKLHKKEDSESSSLLTASLIALFFALSCGSERLFQTFEFTFGLCGPLKLSPDNAVFIDTCYNGGFMVGRFLSMFVVGFTTPKLMLKFSIIVCLISSITISWKAAESAFVLYMCAAFFGFSVSWQFGSAYSWVAENMDVLGQNASIFLIGCNLGGMFTPIGAGYLFNRVAQMSVWYLSLACSLIQLFIYIALQLIFTKDSISRPIHTSSSSNAKYSKLLQDEDQTEGL